MLKKIVVVNAGPRKGWNTDTLLMEAAKGAEASPYKKIAHLLANALADLTMWLNVLGKLPAHSYPVADKGIIDEKPNCVSCYYHCQKVYLR